MLDPISLERTLRIFQKIPQRTQEPLLIMLVTTLEILLVWEPIFSDLLLNPPVLPLLFPLLPLS